jgi:transcriptional regulator with XRE-family HTH domain
MKLPARIRHPETLALLGQQLRRVREAARLPQSRVTHMRQGTVSKIENGQDVTLDTLLTYADSLGLEVALVPIGQAALLHQKSNAGDPGAAAALPAPIDLLAEFDHLADPP